MASDEVINEDQTVVPRKAVLSYLEALS